MFILHSVIYNSYWHSSIRRPIQHHVIVEFDAWQKLLANVEQFVIHQMVAEEKNVKQQSNYGMCRTVSMGQMWRSAFIRFISCLEWVAWMLCIHNHNSFIKYGNNEIRISAYNILTYTKVSVQNIVYKYIQNSLASVFWQENVNRNDLSIKTCIFDIKFSFYLPLPMLQNMFVDV